MAEMEISPRGFSKGLATVLLATLCLAVPTRSSAAGAGSDFTLFDREVPVAVAALGLPATASGPDGDPRRLARDPTALFTSPLRMDRHDVLRLSLAVALVAATHAADDELRDLARGSGGAGGERLAETIRPFGQEAGWVLLGTAYLSGRAFGRERWVAVARDGFEASLLSAGLVAPVFKNTVGRSRPRDDLGSEDFEDQGESFLSGEVTQAFALAAVISAHSDDRWVDATAWGMAGLIGWGRMRLDAHWASDVLAGAILGTAIGRWTVHRNRGGGEPRRWSLRPAMAESASGGSEGFGVGVDLSFD
jgi:hypothetical protein